MGGRAFSFMNGIARIVLIWSLANHYFSKKIATPMGSVKLAHLLQIGNKRNAQPFRAGRLPEPSSAVRQEVGRG